MQQCVHTESTMVQAYDPCPTHAWVDFVSVCVCVCWHPIYSGMARLHLYVPIWANRPALIDNKRSNGWVNTADAYMFFLLLLILHVVVVDVFLPLCFCCCSRYSWRRKCDDWEGWRGKRRSTVDMPPRLWSSYRVSLPTRIHPTPPNRNKHKKTRYGTHTPFSSSFNSFFFFLFTYIYM